jgi:hypothetical protein
VYFCINILEFEFQGHYFLLKQPDTCNLNSFTYMPVYKTSVILFYNVEFSVVCMFQNTLTDHLGETDISGKIILR